MQNKKVKLAPRTPARPAGGSHLAPRRGFTPYEIARPQPSGRAHARARFRTGFTIIELLVVIALIVILTVVLFLNLLNRRSTSELNLTTAELAGLLREAQSRSMLQSSSTAWSVHLDNGAAPFYALYASSTYSTSSLVGHYALPADMRFATTSLVQGATADVFFSQLSGAASGSSSITLYLLSSPNTSTTITIDASTGAVAY